MRIATMHGSKHSRPGVWFFLSRVCLEGFWIERIHLSFLLANGCPPSPAQSFKALSVHRANLFALAELALYCNTDLLFLNK